MDTDNFDIWRLCDELTVSQAALLFIGLNPSENLHVEDQADVNRPEGYHAATTAILDGLKSDRIKGTIERTPKEVGVESRAFLPDRSVVSVDSLKKWLQSKGVVAHPFYLPKASHDEFLDPSHPRYSPKLAAATAAWKLLEDEKLLNGTTPKKAAIKWLRQHANHYGLCDDEGLPSESVIEEIAKIVNWQTKGGAPKTPS